MTRGGGKRLLGAVVGGAVCLGAYAGISAAKGSVADADPRSPYELATIVPTPGYTPVAKSEWPKNAKGQSYGRVGLGLSPDDDPDLVPATASNGRTGYVLSRDLLGPQPKDPQEAIEWSKRPPKLRTIPVYDDRGSVIGSFVPGY